MTVSGFGDALKQSPLTFGEAAWFTSASTALQVTAPGFFAGLCHGLALCLSFLHLLNDAGLRSYWSVLEGAQSILQKTPGLYHIT